MVKQRFISKKLKSMMLFTLVSISVIMSYIYIVEPRQRAYAIKHIKINGVLFPTAIHIHHFRLTDHHGNTFTEENLKGQWTLVFFGFTHCADVCPTTMAALAGMYKILENESPSQKLPKVVFVSVDPERDSAARLYGFINAYHSHFVAASGDVNETQALMNQLPIRSVKRQAASEKDHYMLDHTPDIFIFNREAELQAQLSFPHEAGQLAKDYKSIVMAVD